MTPLGYRRLILTRHAKSSWDDPAMEDRDRPLNARGRAAALELGDFLASRGLEPEEVLCSSATRTRETWDRVERAVIETRPEVSYVEDLYHAAPEMMLQVLRTASAPTVMMLGHNPGIAESALRHRQQILHQTGDNLLITEISDRRGVVEVTGDHRTLHWLTPPQI